MESIRKIRRTVLVACIGLAAATAAVIFRPVPAPLVESTTDRALKESPAGQVAEMALPEEDRKYIWETENVAFQIIYKTGPALAAAVADGDPAAIKAFFASQFVVKSFDVTTTAPDIVSKGFATFQNWNAAKHPRVEWNADKFATWLSKRSQEFRSKPQVQIQVIDLAPTDRTKVSGGWKGRWFLRICGESGSRAVDSHTPLRSMPATFPKPYQLSNGAPSEWVLTGNVFWDRPPKDYLTDRGWITRWEVEKIQWSSAPKGFMRDATREMGFQPNKLHDNWKDPKGLQAVVTGGVFAGDVDDDGRTDLLVTDYGPPHLYMNRGGVFVDEAFERGLPHYRPATPVALLVDLDNDGDEDLLYGRELFESIQGSFVRRGSLALHERASGASAADFDRDGLVDLYISNAAPSPGDDSHARVSWVHDDSGPGNTLFRNLGGFRFSDVTQSANATAGKRSCFTTVWLDADADGWPDAYAINELGNNILLVNQRNGTFAEKKVGPKFDGFAMGVACGDVDNDGWTDLYLGNMKSKVGQRITSNLRPGCYPDDVIESMKRWVGGNILLTCRPKADFVEAPVGADGGGWSYGPALIDFDGDGRLDLYSTCGFISRSRIEPDG